MRGGLQELVWGGGGCVRDMRICYCVVVDEVVMARRDLCFSELFLARA